MPKFPSREDLRRDLEKNREMYKTPEDAKRVAVVKQAMISFEWAYSHVKVDMETGKTHLSIWCDEYVDEIKQNIMEFMKARGFDEKDVSFLHTPRMLGLGRLEVSFKVE